MTIFGLIKKDSGVDFHRITMPLLMMPGIDAYITNGLQPVDLTGNGWKPNGSPLNKPDAIYYNRVVSEDVVKMAHKEGIKIVVDVDDYWLLDPHHIAYNDYMTNKFHELQCKHLIFADAVTTTHERLAEKISEFNKNVTITSNAIPDHPFFKVERTTSEYTRLFWQGSITHERDIELLRGPMRRLNAGKFAAIIAGYTKHRVWDSMVNAFTNGLRLRGLVLEGKPPTEYYQHYAHADICLCPLLDTPFNALKSNLKILEAANLGLPVIASRVHPYLSMPVTYVHRQKDWAFNIMDIVKDDNMRVRGEYLRDYCNRNFNFNTINEKRKECFV